MAHARRRVVVYNNSSSQISVTLDVLWLVNMASVSEICDENNVTNWQKKKKKCVKKETVIKENKVRGVRHINHVGKEVPARCTGPDCR